MAGEKFVVTRDHVRRRVERLNRLLAQLDETPDDRALWSEVETVADLIRSTAFTVEHSLRPKQGAPT